jgi:hypothetical protein
MAGRDRQAGDKLLPKIMAAVVQSVIATKTGLTGHEHAIRVNAGQELIDRMGHEHADLIAPFFRSLLTDETQTPEVRAFIQAVTSGDHQWQAAAGFRVLAGGAASALGTIINDAIAQLVRDVVVKAPNLVPDPSTLASMYSGQFLTDDNYNYWVVSQGYQTAFADAWRLMASSWPDLSVVTQLVQRGVVDTETAKIYLNRNGVPDAVVTQLEYLYTSLLTVQDAALAVLRTDMTLADGRAIAAANGYTDAAFDTLLANTGEPPGAQELMEALRRGFIDEATFRLGIAQSRVRDQWQDTLLALRYSPIATADAVDAYVEGYITEDQVKSFADQNGLEPEQYKVLTSAAGDPLSYTDMMRLWRYGKATEDDVRAALKRGRLKDDYIDFALALKDSPMSIPDAIEASVQGYLPVESARDIAVMNGLRPQDFDPLQLSAGDPLSKTEMLTLYRRGKVTKEQVENALRQSRLKDSYIDLALELQVQLPQLYEVRALLASGGLSAEQGTQILLELGYQEQYVKPIVSNAIGETTGAHKALTETMYLDLYKEGSITADELLSELEALGYTQAGALLIQSIADNQLAISTRNSVIGKIRAGYTGHRIGEQQAQNELNELGVAAEMVDRLIDDWNLIIQTEVKLLTPAQVSDAWFMNLFNPDDRADNMSQALSYLTNLGYSADDATTVLEIKNKGPLANGS